MKQWHPVFVQVLRSMVKAHFELQTTVPVGDAPREADIVLLRRNKRGSLPFRGLWRHLTEWSILEFKGPSVSPRRGDLEALVELGLGVDRRLRASRDQPKRPPVREQVSFWYLANHLGRRFLREAEEALGSMESLGPGLWRGKVLRHLVFLVSGIDLPVEADSVPLHLVGKEPLATEREVAQLLLEDETLQRLYGGWMSILHPSAWEEVEDMARRAGRELTIDWRPAIKAGRLKEIIRQAGVDKLLEQIDKRELVEHLGIEGFLESLSPDQRRELKRRLE